MIVVSSFFGIPNKIRISSLATLTQDNFLFLWMFVQVYTRNFLTLDVKDSRIKHIKVSDPYCPMFFAIVSKKDQVNIDQETFDV